MDQEYKRVQNILFTNTTGAVFQRNKHQLNEMTKKRFAFFKNFAKDMNFKYIHVAGTNGKGSVCATLETYLSSVSTVGVFTSPHIHTMRERIRVNKQLIPKEDMIDIVRKYENLFKQHGDWMVFFDRLQVVALEYFFRKKVEFVILEVGVGGRFDSTNFISNPLATVITSISLDHQAVLGDTLEKIAYQKAGIMKPNVVVFINETQPNNVKDVFKKEAERVGAIIREVPSNRKYKCSLKGKYQHQNIPLAIAVLQHLADNNYIAFSEKNLNGDLESVYWPCRFEIFTYLDKTIILDGSHNKDALDKVFDSVRDIFPKKDIYTIVGICAPEKVNFILEKVEKESKGVAIVKCSHFKALSEDYLKEDLKKMRKLLYKDKNFCVEEGLKWVVENVRGEVILVCGSLFVASDARFALHKLKYVEFPENDWAHYHEFFM